MMSFDVNADDARSRCGRRLGTAPSHHQSQPLHLGNVENDVDF
jgi:hypothetical protein